MSWASTVNDTLKTGTTDGTSTDTQAAITYVDAKNQDGWVITIGAAGGSYTWTAGISMASSFVHSVTLQSAGGDSNKTTINCNFSSPGSALDLKCTNNKLTRVTAFRFLTAGANMLQTGVIGFSGTTTGTARNSFRVDHCRFENCANYGIGVLYPEVYNSGALYGLIDNCVWANTVSTNGIYILAGTAGTGQLDLGEWGGSMTFGTSDTVCIEDCSFTLSGTNTVEGQPAIDSAWYGARWMVRHCTFTNWVLVSHGADSAATSTLQVEVFHNTFNLVTNDAVDFVLYTRGGSIRVYDNIVALTNGAASNQFLKTAIDRGFGRALGFNQIGHGAVAGVETIVPDYIWGNTVPAGAGILVNQPNNPNQTGDNTSGLFVLNTHYFLSAPPGFTELVYPHPLQGNAAPYRLGFRITQV